MDRLTIRDTTAELPAFDPEVDLTPVASLGAQLSDLTLEHVVFANCKLDYAAFERVKTAGPVILFGCSLAEAQFEGCELARALLDGCSLNLTEFDRGAYRGFDLRGNDLSSLRGVTNLHSVVIDRAQISQLAEALTVDLGIHFGDE
jgi:uncharacterized protein YjbI with pentapeptide repeats